MIHFISFSSINFLDAGKRLIQQAKNLCNNGPLFDSVTLFTEEDLKTDIQFWNSHSDFIKSCSKGFGYWIWKPYIILKTLQKIDNNDILLYCDAGCELSMNKINQLKNLFDIVQKDLIICSKTKIEKDWVKKDLLKIMNMDNNQYLNTPQFQTTSICFYNCSITYEFVKIWYELSCNYHNINDSSSFLPEYDSFIEHRHDQSIFSLLLKKHNIISQTKDSLWSDDSIYLLRNKTGLCRIINNVLGFVFTRHVNSFQTNLLWIECYTKIRLYYPDSPIMIIDDNSNYDFIQCSIPLKNCFIIQSEFHGRGEILSYYYYHKYHPFEKAVILHDSTFINKYIDFYSVQDVQFLWSFIHNYDNPALESKFLSKLKNNELLLHLHKNYQGWSGCFGVQSVICFSFLDKIVNKYDFFNLIQHIYSRNERYHIERIFGVICFTEVLEGVKSMFGNIHSYSWGWGYTFENYLNHTKLGVIDHLPIVKVWSGR